MISVCIASFNGELFLKEQLVSILTQLSEEDEIIISDDGSNDQTLEIVSSFCDNRIKVFENSFRNVVKNFNYAISQSKGEIVVLSDQDDIWHEDKIRIITGYFQSNPSTTLVLSNLCMIDKNGEKLGRNFFTGGFNYSLVANVIKNNFIGCGMAFKSTLKPFILPIPERIAMHDWWIGCVALIFGKAEFLDQNLVFYRRHDYNVTSGTGVNYFRRLSYRIILIVELGRRYLKVKFN